MMAHSIYRCHIYLGALPEVSFSVLDTVHYRFEYFFKWLLHWELALVAKYEL